MTEYGDLRIRAMLLGDTDAYRELMAKMTDQDRLAQIKQHLTYHQDIHEDDGWWLLEQAELAFTLGDLLPRKELTITRLRGLLERLEWAVDCYDDPRCAICGAYKHGQPPGRHDPGCELAAELPRIAERPASQSED